LLNFNVFNAAGGKSAQWELYDTDLEIAVFRQEAFFRYLFGVNEPDCIAVLDLTTKEAILFKDDYPEEWQRLG
jgi:hypothetical protein